MHGKKRIKPDQFISEGEYSGKRIRRQDIAKILDSLTLSEMTHMSDLIKQLVRQGQLEKEAYAL